MVGPLHDPDQVTEVTRRGFLKMRQYHLATLTGLLALNLAACSPASTLPNTAPVSKIGATSALRGTGKITVSILPKVALAPKAGIKTGAKGMNVKALPTTL